MIQRPLLASRLWRAKSSSSRRRSDAAWPRPKATRSSAGVSCRRLRRSWAKSSRRSRWMCYLNDVKPWRWGTKKFLKRKENEHIGSVLIREELFKSFMFVEFPQDSLEFVHVCTSCMVNTSEATLPRVPLFRSGTGSAAHGKQWADRATSERRWQVREANGPTNWGSHLKLAECWVSELFRFERCASALYVVFISCLSVNIINRKNAYWIMLVVHHFDVQKRFNEDVWRPLVRSLKKLQSKLEECESRKRSLEQAKGCNFFPLGRPALVWEWVTELVVVAGSLAVLQSFLAVWQFSRDLNWELGTKRTKPWPEELGLASATMAEETGALSASSAATHVAQSRGQVRRPSAGARRWLVCRDVKMS